MAHTCLLEGLKQLLELFDGQAGYIQDTIGFIFFGYKVELALGYRRATSDEQRRRCRAVSSFVFRLSSGMMCRFYFIAFFGFITQHGIGLLFLGPKYTVNLDKR
jgi:hypothetical protein